MEARQLSPNFHEREFFVHEKPPLDVRIHKLPRVVALAQWLRNLVGAPGIVTSYWRSPARNARVSPDAAATSQHMTGEAVDLSFPTISDRELARRVDLAIRNGTAPRFGQMIFYPDTSHVHISLETPRNQQRLMIGSKKPGGGRQYATLTPERVKDLPAVPLGVGVLIFAIGTAIAAAFFFPVPVSA